MRRPDAEEPVDESLRGGRDGQVPLAVRWKRRLRRLRGGGRPPPRVLAGSPGRRGGVGFATHGDVVESEPVRGRRLVAGPGPRFSSGGRPHPPPCPPPPGPPGGRGPPPGRAGGGARWPPPPGRP